LLMNSVHRHAQRSGSEIGHFAVLKVKRLLSKGFHAAQTKRNGFYRFVASKRPRPRRTRKGDGGGVPF
jgi:hypothetical protein